MIKIFLVLFIAFLNLMSSEISWGRFNMKVQLGKRDGFLSTSCFSDTLDTDEQIKLYRKDLSSDQSAYGVALFNVNFTGGGLNPKETILSADLPFNALVSDLLEDSIITNHKSSNDALIKKIKETFIIFNETNFASIKGYSSVIVALFLPHKIVVAHAGDSRAVSSDVTSIMTHDHKPFLPHEKQRIEKAGDVVTKYRDGSYRLNGVLPMSRMFGDTIIDSVIADPDVSIFDYNFKLLATTSHDLDTEFFPVAQFLKRMNLPIYTKNKTETKMEKNIKASSGYRFIIMATADVWNSLPNRTSDYLSWDFNMCDAATDDENGFNDTDKTLINYHCSRLGTAEIATQIVESVLAKHGLNQKSLELATELLHVASVQKEKFNLGSFLNPDIVQKKSFFQKIKGWFFNQRTRDQRILKEINKIHGQNQSIVIIAWDPKNKAQKKLKAKLPHKKPKNT